jgi:hypothetical protein
MDKSLMDRMSSKEDGQDTSEEKLMEMWDMLDEQQKSDILSQMESMCGYKEEGEDESESSDIKGKGGVAIVIQAKK